MRRLLAAAALALAAVTLPASANAVPPLSASPTPECGYDSGFLVAISARPPKARMDPKWYRKVHNGRVYRSQYVENRVWLQGELDGSWVDLTKPASDRKSIKLRTTLVTTRWTRLRAPLAFTTSNGIGPGYDAYRIVQVAVWLTPTNNASDEVATATTRSCRATS